MKTILAGFILSLLINCTIYAQGVWEWGDPFPLTDSVSDNCNPFLFVSPNYFKDQAVFLFWDKSGDSLSTELWMDNILDGEPPTLILSDLGIHYSHPKIVEGEDEILFHVLYQTDQNGNQDIYYLSFIEDGSFSAPIPLAVGPGDDIQLTVSREMFFDASSTELNIISWINNGKLYASTLIADSAQYFTLPVLVDSSDCNAPSICLGGGFFGSWEGSILYEKEDTDATQIYKSLYEGNNIWGIPEVFYDSTSARNPTRMDYYGLECFSAFLDTSWRVLIIDDYGPNYVYDISSPEPFDPAALGGILGVDMWFEGWVAITYPVNEQDEIFLSNMNWPVGFENFSNSGTNNRNPGFFNGEAESSGCWLDYLLYESYRNGHWQIWASKVIQCVGSVDENETVNAFISAYPNPFTHETTIGFSLDSRADVLVEIYNNRGIRVAIIANQNMDQGEHQLRWNAGTLPPGIYFIKLSADNNTYSTKVIRAE